MKIQKEVFYSILANMPTAPPEAGGIIGGVNGSIVIWEFDEGYKECGCVYRPNVDFLNNIIERWLDENYEFMGILHVHFGGAGTLSEGDRSYIIRIMRTMPKYIKSLYFPIIVQPEGKLIPYVAMINADNSISIMRDEMEIV